MGWFEIVELVGVVVLSVVSGVAHWRINRRQKKDL